MKNSLAKAGLLAIVIPTLCVGCGGDNEVVNPPPDGNGQPEMRQITSDPAIDTAPSWAPDASKIAFCSDRSGNFDIWVIADTGGAAIQVTTNSAEDKYPSWSPDGSKIAFASDRSGELDIWVAPATGGNAVQVTDYEGNEFVPSWSSASVPP